MAEQLDAIDFAFVVGAAMGTPGSPEKAAANRFAEAWEAKNFRAMYAELNDASQAQITPKQFAAAYRDARDIATMRGLIAESAEDARSEEGVTVVPVPVRIKTVAFGTIEEELDLPWSEGGIQWADNLVFPGLHRGEKLEAETELAPRAAIRGSSIGLTDVQEYGGPMALRIDRRALHSLEGRFGATLDGGQKVHPYLSAYYVHDFEDGRASFGANFAGGIGPNALFALGAKDKDWFEVSGGLAIDAGPVTLSFGADTTVDRNDVDNQSYRGSIKFRF